MAEIDALRLLVNRYLERTPGDDAVEWAAFMLASGRESEALHALAGKTTPLTWGEAEPLLQRAFADLGLRWRGRWDALWEYAKQIAAEIDDGTRPPFEGLHEIYSVSAGAGHPDDLSAWLALDDGLDPERVQFFSDAQAWSDEIVRQAHALRAAGPRQGEWPGELGSG
jgi:hypothetical protein